MIHMRPRCTYSQTTAESKQGGVALWEIKQKSNKKKTHFSLCIFYQDGQTSRKRQKSAASPYPSRPPNEGTKTRVSNLQPAGQSAAHLEFLSDPELEPETISYNIHLKFHVIFLLLLYLYMCFLY